MKEKFYEISSPPVQLDRLHAIKDLWTSQIATIALKKANAQYLHWEDLKYKNWVPSEIFPDKTLFWSWLKTNRLFSSRLTPVRDKDGSFYRMNPAYYAEFLHLIDKEMGGNFMGVPDLTEDDKRTYITRNIIEESIASSRLEGANTSRAVAKRMLLEGRRPHNHGERMIVNSHRTMQMIEQRYYKEPLSLALIYELHRMITDETIPKPKQGVLRDTFDAKGNRLVVTPWDDTTIAYIAPDREFVEQELPKLIDFANDKNAEKDEFIHPLIKAIILHFWIGLLHPFEDGNGRLARVLFYWYMLRKDYWAFAYLSLSEKIIKSPSQYAMAYIYSEQDDYDLTYFIHYNIEKLKLARKDFRNYITERIEENKLTVSLIQQEHDFNERQIRLLQYLNQKSGRRTSLSIHQGLYGIAKVTAANDLRTLHTAGLLQKKRSGRNIYYYPTNKAAGLLQHP